jgi:XTP/dITP diphosphohydrolase
MAAGVEDRSGTVATALGYADAGGIRVFTGTLQGVLTTERRGDGGFGCDSIFVQACSELTFTEMRARSWSGPTPNRTGVQGDFLVVDPTWNHGN